MAVRMVKCPSCESPLKLSSGMGPGWKVQCPKCEFIFVVGRPEAKEGQTHDKIAAAPEAKHRLRDDYLTDDDESEDDQSDESAPAARVAPDPDQATAGVSRKNLALLLAVGGGGLAIGAVIVYLVMLLNAPSKLAAPPKDNSVPTKDR
ncbi:MAG: hypothetical protein HY040_23685 [Planctomycetes bacterium]|nr:hypothetical protein [Planctomycetota bacterium]